MTTLTRRLAYGVIAFSITTVVGLFMFNAQQNHQAVKRVSEINSRAGIVTESSHVGDDGRMRYTTCEGGWCVTDRVPVRGPLATQNNGPMPTVDIGALEKLIASSKQ